MEADTRYVHLIMYKESPLTGCRDAFTAQAHQTHRQVHASSVLSFKFIANRQSASTVIAANGLVKRDLFTLPNPFAVITVDGAQIQQTSVFKKTLTPLWNESFELCVAFFF
jgi:C2 domain